MKAPSREPARGHAWRRARPCRFRSTRKPRAGRPLLAQTRFFPRSCKLAENRRRRRGTRRRRRADRASVVLLRRGRRAGQKGVANADHVRKAQDGVNERGPELGDLVRASTREIADFEWIMLDVIERPGNALWAGPVDELPRRQKSGAVLGRPDDRKKP